MNPDNPVSSLDRRFLGGRLPQEGHPLAELTRRFDRSISGPARRSGARSPTTFSSRSVSAIKSYWQQMVFSGRGVPPPELDSDGEVVKFVLKNRGAIGYVSGGANVAGAKIVFVR